MADVLNPYAYIGNLHNNGLDFIAQNLLSFDSLPDGVEMEMLRKQKKLYLKIRFRLK